VALQRWLHGELYGGGYGARSWTILGANPSNEPACEHKGEVRGLTVVWLVDGGGWRRLSMVEGVQFVGEEDA